MGSNGTLIREQLHLRGWALLADWKLKLCRHYDQFPPVIQPTSSASRFQQVEDNLAALRILETEAKQQHESTDSAAQSLDLSQTRYEGGVDTYLQVITWQTAALNNERNDIDIMRRRMEASVILIKALGGGWSTGQLLGSDTLTAEKVPR
jgi:hypothetical protein